MHEQEFKLSDGRIVQRSPSGRHRDKCTGKWVSKEDINNLRFVVPCALSEPDAQSVKQNLAPRDYVFQAMERAASEHGFPVESLGEAWGLVMQVQAEIAPDKNNAAKATAAAKMLAQATGIMNEADADQDEEAPWFVLGRELAWEMLSLIQVRARGSVRWGRMW